MAIKHTFQQISLLFFMFRTAAILGEIFSHAEIYFYAVKRTVRYAYLDDTEINLYGKVFFFGLDSKNQFL